MFNLYIKATDTVYWSTHMDNDVCLIFFSPNFMIKCLLTLDFNIPDIEVLGVK